MQESTGATVRQVETGRPWGRRWNWLIGKPDGPGVGLRFVTAAVLIFNGVLAVLRLTSVLGTTDDALGYVFTIAGVCLLPFGALFAWSAYRLQRGSSGGS